MIKLLWNFQARYWLEMHRPTKRLQDASEFCLHCGVQYLQSYYTMPVFTPQMQPPFGWYSFTVVRRVEGWVDLGGWLHTGIKCLLRESNPDAVTCLYAFAVDSVTARRPDVFTAHVTRPGLRRAFPVRRVTRSRATARASRTWRVGRVTAVVSATSTWVVSAKMAASRATVTSLELSRHQGSPRRTSHAIRTREIALVEATESVEDATDAEAVRVTFCFLCLGCFMSLTEHPVSGAYCIKSPNEKIGYFSAVSYALCVAQW